MAERSDFPPQKLKEILGNDTMAVIGYGVQGRAQSLNMRDNGTFIPAFSADVQLRIKSGCWSKTWWRELEKG